MACNMALSGITKDCLGAMGGIRRALIASFDDVTAKTVTDGMITAITTDPAGGAYKLFEFKKNTGHTTVTAETDDTTGVTTYTGEIVLSFLRQETAKRLEIMALIQGDTTVIIEDANGKYWYFGFDEPVEWGTGTAETGTAKTDFNGYNVTLASSDNQMPYEVDGIIIAGLLAAPAA